MNHEGIWYRLSIEEIRRVRKFFLNSNTLVEELDERNGQSNSKTHMELGRCGLRWEYDASKGALNERCKNYVHVTAIVGIVVELI